MKSKSILKKTTYVLFFMFSVFFAKAQTQDQSVPTVTTPSPYDNYDVGQSFTSGLYGTFSSVQIQFRITQTLVQGLTFYLYAGNTITTPIYTKSISSIPAGGGVFSITIDTPVISVPGSVYTWRLIDNAATTLQTLNIVAVSPPSYDAGSSWFAGLNYANVDIWFKTFVNVQTPPPTATDDQTFCNSGTIASIQVSGTEVKWYAESIGGTPIPSTTAIVNSKFYYSSQTLNTLESATRKAVFVRINSNPTPKPTASSTQNLPAAATVANLVATGSNIKWYETPTAGVPLALSFYLVDKKAYYASQTINSCESLTRTAVSTNVAYPLPASCLNFDGVNDAVSLPKITFTGDKFTIETWIKPNKFSTNSNIARQGSGISPDYIFAFYNSGARLSFGLKTGTPLDYLSVNLVTAPTHELLDGNWHHIAAVYDGATRKIYIDGILRGTNAKTGNITSLQATNIIGNSAINGTEPFSGSIDEIRFWTRALTGCEIATNKNCELPEQNQTNLWGYYKCNQALADFENLYDTNLADYSVNGNDGTLNGFALTGTTSNWTLLGGVVTGTTCAAFAGSTTIAPTTTTPQSFPAGASVSNLTATGSNIQWYSLASGGTLLASSDALVNGTTYYASQTVNSCESLSRVAVVANVAVPVPASSLNFDGINDAVSLPAFNFGGDKLTIEAWIKPTKFSTFYSDIVGQGTATSDYKLSFLSYGAFLTFGIKTGTSYDQLYLPSKDYGTNFLDGNWHHIAAVYDGTTRKIYVDGSLRVSDAKTGNITNLETVNTIGNASASGYEQFNGSIDEIRFWTRALTECEINTNKNCELSTNQTGLYAYYKFNDGVGNVANTANLSLVDSSNNSRTGTLSGFSLTNGIISNWTTSGGVVSGTTCNTYTGSTTVAPTATANQTFCDAATIASLVATGSNIKWYNTASGGTALGNSFALSNGATYYASQAVANCEGNSRTAVSVVLTTLPVAPVASPTQSLSNGSIVSNLVATPLSGSIINWYAVASGGSPLDPTTVLGNANTYYSSQTVNGCESGLRSAVVVNLVYSGSSLSFDGTDDFVNMTGIVLNEQGISIELWVKPTNFDNSTSMLVYRAGHANHAAGTDPMYYLAFTSNGNNLDFGIKTGLQFCCPTFPNHVQSNKLSVGINKSSFLDGNWHHIAAVYDGQTRKIYIDGLLAGSDNRTGSVFESVPQTAITIGNINNNSGFNGNIDEVRLWGRALSGCEINNNKNCELPSGQTDLAGYFKFNDGESNTSNESNLVLYNTANNTVNGTLNNFELLGSTSNWTNAAGVTTGSNCEVFVPTPAPVATATQTFCTGATVASLIATGTGINWYITSISEVALTSNLALVAGKYFASQTINGCESTNRAQVDVNFFEATPTPTAIALQIFVSGSTLESLPVDGTNILWYSTETGNSPLSKTTLLVESGVSYFASQTLNGCESVGRVAISTTQISQATQTLPSPATLADLIVTVPLGYQAYWFSSMTSTPSLPLTTIIKTGTYYVLIAPVGSNLKLTSSSATNQTLLSSNRVAVNVVITDSLGIQAVNSKLNIQLNPNPSNGIFNFNLSNDSKIDVYNQLGQLILNQKRTTGSNSIDLTNYSSGIYFMKISDESNQTKVMKLIKK